MMFLAGVGSANSINNKGQIVGYANTQENATHCVLWSGGTIQDLSPRLHGQGSDGVTCAASSINNLGTVVGHFYSHDIDFKPFVWRDGRKISLDQSVLSVNSVGFLETANGINDKGQIVVNSSSPQSEKAYLLTPTWVTQ